MKKIFLLGFTILTLLSCSTKKHVEIALNSGNYDQVISSSIKKLRNNKYKKRNFEYMHMLQDAFHKAADRDLNMIAHFKKENNPEHYRKIYELYLDLNERQNKITPLLPLKAFGEEVAFNFKEYSGNIIDSKDRLSGYLYEKATVLLKASEKGKIRHAYKILEYLDKINPNYANTRGLLEEAHDLGRAYVYVTVSNESNIMMPAALEEDLLALDIYDHNKFWSEYHTNPVPNLEYDYTIQLKIKNIEVSPEQVKMREYHREREIVDGWKYELDANGNVLKDSLGNDIKVDKIVKVKCNVLESNQFKTSHVMADVEFIDLTTNQIVDKFSLNSNFVFENVFARIDGDKRALNAEDKVLLKNPEVAFPSDEQMIYDTGEDLKLQLRKLIKSYSIKI